MPVKFRAPYGALAELSNLLASQYGARALPTEEETKPMTEAEKEQWRRSTSRSWGDVGP
jgi:hypothetical protein